jgi:hypothetical protein
MKKQYKNRNYENYLMSTVTSRFSPLNNISHVCEWLYFLPTHQPGREQPPTGSYIHRRMARGGHKLSEVSPGPAMPYPSTPCHKAVAGVAHPRTCGRLLSPVPRRTPIHITGSIVRLAVHTGAKCLHFGTSSNL